MARHYGWLLNRDSTLLANRYILFGLLACLKMFKTFETAFKNWEIQHESLDFCTSHKKLEALVTLRLSSLLQGKHVAGAE